MKLFATLAIIFVTASASASTDLTAQRSFPERVSIARLPSADRARLGPNRAEVRVCVAPDGAVHSLAVARSSGSPEFDQAIVSDVATWRYRPYRAPASVKKLCEQVTISYLGR